jgi:hypothetical protein
MKLAPLSSLLHPTQLLTEDRKMRCFTERYEFAHGRRPRGRGNWAFTFEGGHAHGEIFRATSGLTFSEARREAERKARRHEARGIHVES